MTPEFRSAVYAQWLVEAEVELAPLVNGAEPKDRAYKRARATLAFEERDGVAVLSSGIEFAAAGSDWGKVSALRVVSAGVALFDAPLKRAKLIEAGDILFVEEGGISFEIKNRGRVAAMSMSNATETDLLNLFFKDTTLPWDAITDLYLGLHTADPGEAGTQQANEATYTGYARIPVVRTAGGWTVAGNTVTNTALAQFDPCTAGTNTITHVSIGTVISGAGQIIVSGALNASLAVSAGIQPQFAIGVLSLTAD